MEIMGLHLPGAAFVNPEHAAARCADRGRGAARAADHRAGRRLHADRQGRRRARDRQRHRRAARHRRLDQPHDPPGRDGAAAGMLHRLGRLQRPVGGGAAAGQDLSERQGRREPLPCRGRHGLPDRAAARCGPAARGRVHGRRRKGCARYARRAVPGRRRGVTWRDGAERERRRERAAPASPSRSPPTAASSCSAATWAARSSRCRRSSPSTASSKRRRSSSTTRKS